MASAGYVPPSTFALGHIGLGDWDAAFEWLDRAIEARDPIVMPIKTFPFLDPVRGDPRYPGAAAQDAAGVSRSPTSRLPRGRRGPGRRTGRR